VPSPRVLDSFEVAADKETVKVYNVHGVSNGTKKDRNTGGEANNTTSSSCRVPEQEQTESIAAPIATKTWAKVCSTEPLRNTQLSVEATRSDGNQRSPTPPAEKLHALADGSAQSVEAGMTLSEADVPLTFPPLPPTSATSPVLSDAKFTLSPSEPAGPPFTGANVPPQPKGKSEVPTSKEASILVNQPLDNLYVMIRQQRQGLLRGPQITVYSGKNAVNGIFKRAAMAASPVLNEHFVKNPKSLEYHLSTEDVIDPDAIRFLLDTYIHQMSQVVVPHAADVQEKFSENIAILRAARKLRMEPYTKHILNVHVNYLKEFIPSYEEIAIVELNKTSNKDPLWTNMLNHLSYARHKEYIPDPYDFEAFLEKHPVLKRAMAIADRYFYGKE
jgi:hypothetical protein